MKALHQRRDRGKLSKTGTAGYIATFPIPEV